MVFKLPSHTNHPRILWMIYLRNKTHWCGQLLHSQKESPCPELAQEYIPATAGGEAQQQHTITTWISRHPIHPPLHVLVTPQSLRAALAEALRAHRWSGERPMPMMCPWMSMT